MPLFLTHPAEESGPPTLSAAGGTRRQREVSTDGSLIRAGGLIRSSAPDPEAGPTTSKLILTHAGSTSLCAFALSSIATRHMTNTGTDLAYHNIQTSSLDPYELIITGIPPPLIAAPCNL